MSVAQPGSADPVAPAPAGPRAPFATRPAHSRGRRLAEAESPTRTVFQRDRDRILHAAAFRRLQHKTQVFVYHIGDHYRTRLTHSLEVAQITRSICRTLGLDEDLGEAQALAHDLGHPPFGHAGEDALDRAMQPYGGFDHNAQTLRILTRLEHRYAGFDGLNLTWEMLEGVVKHNGPLLGPLVTGKSARRAVPQPILDYVAEHDLELSTHAGPEAQVAAISDDIAYNNHDIDDGLRAGLFAIDDLHAVPLVGGVFEGVARAYPGIEPSRLIHESVRRLISIMVEDVIVETRRRIVAAEAVRGPLRGPEDVRALDRPLVAFSDAMRAHDAALKAFLRTHMYSHWKVNRMTSKARRVVTALFNLLLDEPGCLPQEWRARAGAPGDARTARLVADFIAGMTDRFALAEHARLFDLSE
ncbi:deoxyguanosinetriphosphate triphosphohydrolase [Zavarzinia sp. CC-PAN008]|uniref:deoxyguanosinetriphosphate triphosphohydrolase n=1 Tax=Zavarzinia sp. CC-PAN008 TaxID=3243332 RepID=UPI003F742B64